MKITDNGTFYFEKTGRTFSTHGQEGISLTASNEVRYGYDGYVTLIDEEGYEDNELLLTDEEKKELAEYMIKIWSKFGKI